MSPASLKGKESVILWLVRHGQTDWNLEGRYQGHADPPLNAAGLAEAERAARAFTGMEVDAVITSDLQRAVQTAAAISKQVGVPYRTDTRLREVDLGDWEGCLFPEIQARYPEMVEARKREPIDFRPPGGESLREVAHRVWEVADEIAIRYPGKRVVLVSHGLALAALLVRSLGEDLGAAFGHVPPNAVPQHVTWKAGTQSVNVHANTLILKQEKKGG